MRNVLLLSIVLAHPALGALRINEVHVDPLGPDLIGAVCYDYIEIVSDTGGVESLDNCKLMLLDTDGGDMGRVDGLWDLHGLSTGSNGLLLLGLNFAATRGGPWADHVHAETAVADIAIPPGKNGLAEPNRACSLILVKNYTGFISVGTTDVSPTDTILTLAIRNTLLDSVGFNEHREGDGDSVPPSPIADLSQSGYSPDSVSRLVGNFAANSAAAWFGGEIVGDSPTSVIISPTQRFGTMPNPAATPGAPNSPLDPADLRINEVAVNPAGTDGNHEYIELLKVGGTSNTGEGYHLLVVNTDPSSDATCGTDRSLGVIVEAWDLGEVEFGANGLALLGDDYDSGRSPWRNDVDPDTALFDIGISTDPDPIRQSRGDLGNQIYTRDGGLCTTVRTHDGFTLLLVTGFSGTPLQDLDTNDDGLLDVQPWDEIVDSVGYNGLAATYAPCDLSEIAFAPDNISRKAGNTTPNDPLAFYGGNHAGSNPYHIGFGTDYFGGFRGQASPGRENLNAEAPVAPFLISEVNFNPPGEPAEFIELQSAEGGIAPAQGLSLLVVSTDSGNRGVVLQAYDLGDFSSGPNGLLLLGDDMEAQAAAHFPAGTVRAETVVANGPPGFQAGDLPDDSFALLLAIGFSGGVGTDLDANGDGAIDPEFTIVDGFTLGPLAHPAVADLSGVPLPANVSRTGTQWYGGTIAGSAPGGLAFDTAFGPWTGTVTPGQLNHNAPPLAAAVLLNELHIDPPVANANYDYVELLSSALSAQSMNGLTLVLIDTYAGGEGAGNVGEIDAVWHLDALATGPNGLLLLGNGYDDGGPFAGVMDPLTATGAPLDMGDNALAPPDGFALLLVRGFTGALDMDLDAANNGVLDSTPWTEVVDAVAFGNVNYGFPDLSQPGFSPDNLSRGGRIGDLVALDASHWYGGDVLGTSGTSTAFDPAERFDYTGVVPAGNATPGRFNLGRFLDDFVDSDLDGLVNLMELSLATDPNQQDQSEFPANFLVDVDGQPHLALQFSRVKGGTGSVADYTAGGIRTVVQVSEDLLTWVPAGSEIVIVSITESGDGFSETVVVRLAEPAFSEAPQRFLRLQATRM